MRARACMHISSLALFIREIPFMCHESRPCRNRKWILKICHKWHRSRLVRTCPYPIWIRRRSTDLSFDLFSIMTHISRRHFSRDSRELLKEDDRDFLVEHLKKYIRVYISAAKDVSRDMPSILNFIILNLN